MLPSECFFPYQQGAVRKVMRERLTEDLKKAFAVEGELHVQTRHRIELAEFWNPEPGFRILEVGCGPGDTTAVLAAAVGEGGHITAVEKAPDKMLWELTGLPTVLTPDNLPLPPAVEKFLSRYVYGSSPSLGAPMPRLLASPLGHLVSFHVCLDLLDPEVDFEENAFDMIVFSHSSWYFEHPQILSSIFRRAHRWAKRLAYAEWNLMPNRFSQVSHLLAALLQTHILSLCPTASRYNVVSLITPAMAREMAEEAGWQIVRRTELDCSTLQDGIWEGRVAHELVRDFAPCLDDYARSLVLAEQQLLIATERLLGGATSLNPEERELLIRGGKIHSLSTHAFVAMKAP